MKLEQFFLPGLLTSAERDAKALDRFGKPDMAERILALCEVIRLSAADQIATQTKRLPRSSAILGASYRRSPLKDWQKELEEAYNAQRGPNRDFNEDQ